MLYNCFIYLCCFFFFQAEDGIRDHCVTGVQDVCSSDLIGNDHNMQWLVFGNDNLCSDLCLVITIYAVAKVS